jgi:hypothetical protein
MKEIIRDEGAEKGIEMKRWMHREAHPSFLLLPAPYLWDKELCHCTWRADYG